MGGAWRGTTDYCVVTREPLIINTGEIVDREVFGGEMISK